jgi:hypothetical protein
VPQNAACPTNALTFPLRNCCRRSRRR